MIAALAGWEMRARFGAILMEEFQFHPAVAKWFEQEFGSPSEPQQRGWPAIQAGDHVLISAPTGSGKTLAAFLASLDQLFREALTAALPDETRVLYVSPLKALSNDIHKNLEAAVGGHPRLVAEGWPRRRHPRGGSDRRYAGREETSRSCASRRTSW